MSGQLEVVNGGAPFVYFDLGGGKCATCNPISEPDLAAALVDTIADKAKENALWNLGASSFPKEGQLARSLGRLGTLTSGSGWRDDGQIRSRPGRASAVVPRCALSLVRLGARASAPACTLAAPANSLPNQSQTRPRPQTGTAGRVGRCWMRVAVPPHEAHECPLKTKHSPPRSGGPDEGLSMRQQGELVADVLGKEEAKLLGVPIGIFDVIVDGLQGAANLAGKAARFDGFPESVPQWARDQYAQTMAGWAQSLEDSAEFGRIGRYYAVEDMLTTDPADKYGRTTLRQHYERIAVEGQEYDPYTSVFGSKASKEALKEAAK